MRVYYALYDQSYDNNAQYWTWFPEEITKQMRDAIASKSGAFQMRPKRPNLLTEPDIVGGIINYQDQWCVVYRFFNGGNDPQGRPDRCVLATAWVKAEEAQGQNLYNLLFCPVFLNVQKQALYQCPVQAPKALIEDCNYPVSQNDPQFVIYNNNPNIGSWSFRSPDEVEVIGKLFPSLIGDGLKSLQVLQSASYMETFSGTPLASGISYVSKVMPSESAYISGYDSPVQQFTSWNSILGFLLVLFFFLASLLAFDYLTNHSLIKSVFQVISVIERHFSEEQNSDEQIPDEQIPEKQIPEEQTPEEQIPEGQISEEQTPNEQNLHWQNLNGNNPEQPIYPPEQPIKPDNPSMEPNGIPGAPLMDL